MIGPGWSWTQGGPQDQRGPLPTATVLDLDPDQGRRSPEGLVRPYHTGRPDPVFFAEAASRWFVEGRRVQVMNEPNIEGGFSGPADFAAWFEEVVDACPPDARLYWTPPSPGLSGWENWYTDPACQRAIGRATGLSVHCYGSSQQMLEVVRSVADICPGRPLWISEANFGAGNVADIDAWARDELGRFLDEVSAIAEVEAVNYFAPYWDQSATLPTSVDGFGTAVEDVLHSWVPPDPFEPIPPPDPLEDRRNRTWAIADEWEAAGWWWTGQSIKAATALGKGER
jgi:hypothetical protein